MIHRIIVVSKMKDIIRAEFEKYFQSYIIYQVDKYKNNIKDVAYVLEIDGIDDDKDDSINKAALGISKALKTDVLVERYESASNVIRQEVPVPQAPITKTEEKNCF